MKYKISNYSLKLIDSYLVSKRNFSKKIAYIKKVQPGFSLWFTRSERPIINEWASHNLAYLLHYRRNKTANVDFEFKQAWYNKLLYGIVGPIALLIIK